jgi:quercetin dioxygenase-like cupin family protein
MGGQRITDLALARIAPTGAFRPHRPMAEEAFVVLRGSGTTAIWNDAGRWTTIRWRQGDLVSPPFGAWRQHRADEDTDARLLLARSTVIERALGLTDQTGPWRLDGAWPDRLDALASAGLIGIESA